MTLAHYNFPTNNIKNPIKDIAVATHPFLTSFERAFNQKISVICDDMYAFDDAKLIIFTGGGDISPYIYGEDNWASYGSSVRDFVELKILDMCLKSNKKILGVCRGHQLINAYFGGKLVQDLFRGLGVSHNGHHELIYLTQESIIGKFFQNGVNSMHHQGVIEVGDGLIPTSEYEGVYESCEGENILTVQFHPESMVGKDTEEFFEYLKEWKES